MSWQEEGALGGSDELLAVGAEADAGRRGLRDLKHPLRALHEKSEHTTTLQSQAGRDLIKSMEPDEGQCGQEGASGRH